MTWLRSIFETIPAMVYTMNVDGDIELVNEGRGTPIGGLTPGSDPGV